MPSAVSRLLSQLLQNGSVVDEMMPNTVPSGSRKRSAGALVSSTTAVIGPYSLAERRQHVLPRHHAIARPLRGAADVHVFDEANLGADALRVLEQRNQLVFVRAANDHRIELDARRSSSTASSMPASTCGKRIEARERLKAIGAQRVEADRQAMQPGAGAARARARRA